MMLFHHIPLKDFCYLESWNHALLVKYTTGCRGLDCCTYCVYKQYNNTHKYIGSTSGATQLHLWICIQKILGFFLLSFTCCVLFLLTGSQWDCFINSPILLTTPNKHTWLDCICVVFVQDGTVLTLKTLGTKGRCMCVCSACDA